MPDTDSLLTLLGNARHFDLEHERYAGAPVFPAHSPGFVYTLHRHHEAVAGQSRTSASGTIITQEHFGTHLDALCHQAVDMCLHGDIPSDSTVQTATGFSALGVETVPPILRRGVLLDIAAAHDVARLPAGYLVTSEDLQAAKEQQQVDVHPGDCVLIRTGGGATFADPDTYLDTAGVSAGGARWLAALQPFLCGADNVSFDHPGNDDPDIGSLPCHSILIVEHGIYLMENLMLEDLAQARCNEFAFVCLPLKMRGVTGSQVRPLALSLTNHE